MLGKHHHYYHQLHQLHMLLSLQNAYNFDWVAYQVKAIHTRCDVQNIVKKNYTQIER